MTAVDGLELGDDLDSAAAGTDDADTFVGEVVGFVPFRRVHRLAFETPETLDVGPLWVVEESSRTDQDICCVGENLTFGLLDFDMPLSFLLVPFTVFDFMLHLHESIGAEFSRCAFDVVANLP